MHSQHTFPIRLPTNTAKFNKCMSKNTIKDFKIISSTFFTSQSSMTHDCFWKTFQVSVNDAHKVLKKKTKKKMEKTNAKNRKRHDVLKYFVLVCSVSKKIH